MAFQLGRPGPPGYAYALEKQFTFRQNFFQFFLFVCVKHADTNITVTRRDSVVYIARALDTFDSQERNLLKKS